MHQPCTLLILLVLASLCTGQYVLRTTPKGTLRGSTNSGVTSFTGVPYALSPTGTRRWKDPLPFPSWAPATRDALTPPPACYQSALSILPSGDRQEYPYGVSEDCLFLNVYMKEGTAANANKPVALYIHGGAYQSGDGYSYVPDLLVKDADIIVVNFNYRVGAFGFAYAPGLGDDNPGLKDQEMAIRWVQDNIASLGGDPYRITLFGHSAGASSILLHLVNLPVSLLFQAAWLISTAAYHYPTTTQITQVTMALSTALGCGATLTPAAKTCLYAKSAADILAASLPPFSYSGYFIPFVGSGSEISGDPIRIIERSEAYLEGKAVVVQHDGDEGAGILWWFTGTVPSNSSVNAANYLALGTSAVPAYYSTAEKNAFLSYCDIPAGSTNAQYWNAAANCLSIFFRCAAERLSDALTRTLGGTGLTSVHRAHFIYVPDNYALPISSATHASDSQNFFPNLNNTIRFWQGGVFTTDSQGVSKDLWSRLNKLSTAGNVNHLSSGGMVWPAFNTATRKVYQIDRRAPGAPISTATQHYTECYLPEVQGVIMS